MKNQQTVFYTARHKAIEYRQRGIFLPLRRQNRETEHSAAHIFAPAPKTFRVVWQKRFSRAFLPLWNVPARAASEAVFIPKERLNGACALS